MCEQNIDQVPENWLNSAWNNWYCSHLLFHQNKILICLGGSKPRVSTPLVIRKICEYKMKNHSLYAWEIREKLCLDQVCPQNYLPSISSINRIIRNLHREPLLNIANIDRLCQQQLSNEPYKYSSVWNKLANNNSLDYFQLENLLNTIDGKKDWQFSDTKSTDMIETNHTIISDTIVNVEQHNSFTSSTEPKKLKTFLIKDILC